MSLFSVSCIIILCVSGCNYLDEVAYIIIIITLNRGGRRTRGSEFPDIIFDRDCFVTLYYIIIAIVFLRVVDFLTALACQLNKTGECGRERISS